MNRSFVRVTLAIMLVLGSLLTVFGPGSASASHLPPPSEIVIRPAELPFGFAPVDEPGVASMLPDGLARQAAASFRRDAALAAEPGISYAKQVVLAFDDRDATEYLARFRDLMVRHQGYTVVEGGETEFRLVRTRGEETSAVAGSAFGEVLIVTTVAGLPGTVGPNDAANLTQIAVARVPVVEQSAAVLSTADTPLSLANAHTGGSHMEMPSNLVAGRWPYPVVELPPGPELAVVQRRSQRPGGDPELDAMMPSGNNQVRPANWSTDLMTYTRSIGPIMDEFWARALGQNSYVYHSPRYLVVPEGEVVMTPCIDHSGEPSPADNLAYCPVDETIYIYEPFLRDELIAGQDWRARDYVIATVIAHEWAHHVQTIHGYDEAAEIALLNDPNQWPLVTRQGELQADCFAGLFTRYARDAGWLNVGDVDEAKEALFRAGDHHFNSPGHHGTPEQRREWFMRGYVHNSFRACDAW